MVREGWIRGGHISFSELQAGRMLRKMRVRFLHHEFIQGREVDFLIPRPGRPGLIVEVDGDIFHLDEKRKAERDRMLKSAGWEVVHFWSSEVIQLPKSVQQALEKALEGVPRIPEEKKKRSHRTRRTR